jgi:hypothetical protein
VQTSAGQTTTFLSRCHLCSFGRWLQAAAFWVQHSNPCICESCEKRLRTACCFFGAACKSNSQCVMQSKYKNSLQSMFEEIFRKKYQDPWEHYTCEFESLCKISGSGTSNMASKMSGSIRFRPSILPKRPWDSVQVESVPHAPRRILRNFHERTTRGRVNSALICSKASYVCLPPCLRVRNQDCCTSALEGSTMYYTHSHVVVY